MTIHFRSRIQSPIDYSEYLFPGTNGYCCTGGYPDFQQPFQTSYGNCNALGGHFRVTPEGCLPIGITGCCCACAYGGATSGIEYSLCQDLDGVWVAGDCPPEPICTDSNGRGVTFPRACCGFTYDSAGDIISECFEVCTEKECYALRLGNFASTFYPTNSNCSSVTCTSPQIAPMNDNRDKIFGNCCVQGIPCRCYKNLTFEACEVAGGAFYILGDPEFSCDDCVKNCSEGN